MDKQAPQLICSQLELMNFRCFTHKVITFEHPVAFIEGLNGTGKTSLLEAIYYGCYLRSFRTHISKELIHFDSENFFLKYRIHNEYLTHEIQVGFSDAKRLVKIDAQSITSYKDLIKHYRVISLTEDDLDLIKGYPQERRAFIDQVIVLYNADFALLMRTFKNIVLNRTSIVKKGNSTDQEYLFWTRKLWEQSIVIQKERKRALAELAIDVRHLIKNYFDDQYELSFSYVERKPHIDQSFDEFVSENKNLFDQEIRQNRILFGAHLDDISILFHHKKSKQFASRGQQKIILLFMKIAQIQRVKRLCGPVIFLLDDFMADFDNTRAKQCIDLIHTLGVQLIFTSPIDNPVLTNYRNTVGAQRIDLTY